MLAFKRFFSATSLRSHIDLYCYLKRAVTVRLKGKTNFSTETSVRFVVKVRAEAR